MTGRTFVNTSIRKPGMYSGGITGDEAARFRRNAARFHQLDKLARTVRQLAAAVGIKSEGDRAHADDDNEQQGS